MRKISDKEDISRTAPAQNGVNPETFSVLYISGTEGSTRRYRCFHPQEQLELYGIPTGFRDFQDLELYQDVLDYDLFVLHRVPYNRVIGDILEFARQRGKITVYETDDLVFDPELIEFDGFYQALTSVKARLYEDFVRGQAETLEKCDYALTTTEFLAQRLMRKKKCAFISRNSLSVELMQISSDAYQRRLSRHWGATDDSDERASGQEKVVIGYFSGSESHDRDFGVVAPALLRLMRRHPHVQLHIFGHLRPGNAFHQFGSRVRQTSYMPWQELPYAVAQVDINIAPLELDNPFCQSKSELKYFEAGIVGVPTIASRTEAFEYAIRHGENGFLAATTEEWLACLDELAANPRCREAMGEAARHDVLENYTPQARGKELVQTLHGLISDHRPPPQTLRSEDQVRRQAMDVLIGYLQNYDRQDQPWRTPQGRAASHQPQHVPFDVFQSALHTVGRIRRRPDTRAFAWAKHLVKKLTRQFYVLELEGQTYRLLDELIAGQTYGQVFQATAPNLSAVRVLFATFGRINTPDLTFRLKRSPTSVENLVTRTVSASLLQDNRFFSFAFEPLRDSDGTQYFFSIQAHNAVRGDTVALWTRLDPKMEARTMYRDGQLIAGQLAYTLHYASHRENIQGV